MKGVFTIEAGLMKQSVVNL